MYALTVDVPRTAPATVPIASASNACRARGSWPSRISPARDATPMSVPIESNSARKKNTKMTSIIPGLNAPRMSSFMNVGASDGGAREHAVELHQTGGEPDDGRPTHAEQHRAVHAARQQHGHQRHRPQREQHGRRRQAAEGDEGARRRDDDPAPLEPDQGNQQTDADADRVLQ